MRPCPLFPSERLKTSRSLPPLDSKQRAKSKAMSSVGFGRARNRWWRGLDAHGPGQRPPLVAGAPLSHFKQQSLKEPRRGVRSLRQTRSLLAVGTTSCRLGSPSSLAHICPSGERKRLEGQCPTWLPRASLWFEGRAMRWLCPHHSHAGRTGRNLPAARATRLRRRRAGAPRRSVPALRPSAFSHACLMCF